MGLFISQQEGRRWVWSAAVAATAGPLTQSLVDAASGALACGNIIMNASKAEGDN